MSKRPGTYNGGGTIIRTHPVGFNDEPESPPTITEPIMRGRGDYKLAYRLRCKANHKGKPNFKPRPNSDK